MTRNLKALGLALVAMLAMSALAAGAAQAAGEEFHSDAANGHTVLTGHATSNQVFTIPGVGSVTCNEISAEGDIEPNTTDEATVGFEYTHNAADDCESTFGEAGIDDDGCHYLFSSDTGAGSSADVTLEGCSGGTLEITVTVGCTIKVANQSLVDAVSYGETTVGGKEAITGEASISEDVNFTSSGFICALGGVPSSGEADYTGSFVVEGFEYEGGETGSYEEGTRVNVWKE